MSSEPTNGQQEAKILIVDDEEGIRDLLKEHLAGKGYSCLAAANGLQALQILHRDDVSLLLTDIRMPVLDGMELLKQVRTWNPDISVVMITAVTDLDVAIQAMRQGALDYITKPFHLETLAISVQRALERRELTLENRRYQQELEKKVAERTRELVQINAQLRQYYLDTIKALSHAIEARDRFTHDHVQRVTEYAKAIALELGWKGKKLEELEVAAPLHDVGKIGIPDAILNKPGPLSAEEFEVMKTHPRLGMEIISGIEFLAFAFPYILYHQERYDGQGYPLGLAGEQIPLEARIMALVDAFDAMTSDRPYRRAMDPDLAVAEIERCSGTQFDPKVVEVFLELWKQGKLKR